MARAISELKQARSFGNLPATMQATAWWSITGASAWRGAAPATMATSESERMRRFMSALPTIDG
ncbi:MAG: hypothetical protein DMF81_14280 [Acidobacteria bacterium]|nr:MAG: hypothetical protein DMF81_14280 [Acidobacteriota bacterium]